MLEQLWSAIAISLDSLTWGGELQEALSCPVRPALIRKKRVRFTPPSTTSFLVAGSLAFDRVRHVVRGDSHTGELRVISRVTIHRVGDPCYSKADRYRWPTTPE